MEKKWIFYFLLMLAYISTISVGYSLIKYFIGIVNSLRHEYLIGAVMVIYFTSPICLGLSLMALFRKGKLSKLEFISALLPTLFMVTVLMGIYLG